MNREKWSILCTCEEKAVKKKRVITFLMNDDNIFSLNIWKY